MMTMSSPKTEGPQSNFLSLLSPLSQFCHLFQLLFDLYMQTSSCGQRPNLHDTCIYYCTQYPVLIQCGAPPCGLLMLGNI